MEMKDRIRAARKAAGHASATKGANAYGWTVSTYLGYENGARNPSLEAIAEIALAFRAAPARLHFFAQTTRQALTQAT